MSVSDAEFPAYSIVSRARGCMLGLMCGDALGAGVEGWPPDEIEKLAKGRWNSQLVEDYIDAVHMASHVSAGEPGRYREARPFETSGFVPTGPPRNQAVAAQCARRGMYTDDTNACLALAASIVEQGGVDAHAVALSYARFWLHGDAVRGCPPTAQRVMQAVLDGASADETGLPPHFPFEGGSFANGGAMRISPLAISHRTASPAALRAAVELAIRSSHRHPEAIDFAVVQAAAVQYALLCVSPSDFAPQKLLADLAARCETASMQQCVEATASALAAAPCHGDGQHRDFAVVSGLVGRERRPGSGMGFQIASVHCLPCVLWCVGRYHASPRRAVQEAIALGGDTDTVASMVGAVVGALHGEEWCAQWAAQLENGPHGRDFEIGRAHV